jgi:hypothetical protein
MADEKEDLELFEGLEKEAKEWDKARLINLQAFHNSSTNETAGC